MNVAFRMPLEQARLIGSQQTSPTGCTKEEAEQANLAFDASVKQFLRDWIDHGTALSHLPDPESDVDEFIEQGALRCFFKHREDAFQQLLDQEAIARHLLRPITDVFFDSDAYEPLLARYERRIYNLAAHRRHLEVPFRYSPPSRQEADGDTIDYSAMPADQVREDIGMYFGTRRSDETALTIMGGKLRQEAWPYTHLPIHVVTEGYMEESLRAVKMATGHLQEKEDFRLHCFLIHRRHAADDRHLGAALLLMNPKEPNQPHRVIFCDTLNPGGIPPWWHKFKHKLDTVFPQPEGYAPVSDRLEDGGVNLQRLHDGVPVRHQDIDCAFYSFSMVRALIGVAKLAPHVILHGPAEKIVGMMTARMPEYFVLPNQPRDPVLVREENVWLRWNTGREALKNLKRKPAVEVPMPQMVVETTPQAIELPA
ncbi:hypothetical protein GCM10023187_17740 [Nibrella viscosa]|uniref:Uncharacterized protein n=1 Tax=Nibrella viscosa TaxID=1084524 RepID=A0ABP8K9P3_9BACT